MTTILEMEQEQNPEGFDLFQCLDGCVDEEGHPKTFLFFRAAMHHQEQMHHAFFGRYRSDEQ